MVPTVATINGVKIVTVEPVVFGVLKIVWADGFEAVVDLRPVLSDGAIYEFLRNTPGLFKAVKLEQFGHYIYWLDPSGDEIEFGSDALRRRAVRQADILRLAS